jgi:hypothetical protein
VILGASEADLDAARGHEQVHVRQYERWGPFFLPAYLASSAWQLACGRRCYRDNCSSDRHSGMTAAPDPLDGVK